MTTPDIHLASDDAMELAELFGLLIDWIDTNHEHLPASLHHFIGNDGYNTTALRTDLARFQLLLG